MAPQTFSVLMNLLVLSGGLFALYGLWFCIVGVFGLKRHTPYAQAPPTTRFAVVVAARNEEKVIGTLVDSLLRQNYPADMFDVFVAPNNCTDNTHQAALRHGAKIFVPQGVITSKGDVLAQLGDMLIKSGKYDAMCVFDADNVVPPSFLRKMNNARQSGGLLAQGRREATNPTQTTITSMCAVYYGLVNRFYNGGREALGLSSLLVGSGFMVSLELLARMGGWRTVTVTEDYEFTGQSVLMGEKVHYVAEAVYYDELPLTFAQSWIQRRRWCTGFTQSMERYCEQLVRYTIKHKSMVAFDMALAYVAPVLQFFSLLFGLASALLSAYGVVVFNMMPVTRAILLAAALGVAAVLACSSFAWFIVAMDARRLLGGMAKGIALFSLFLLSWLPLTLMGLFFKKTRWDVIEHHGNILS